MKLEFHRGLATPKVILIMPKKADSRAAAKGTFFYTMYRPRFIHTFVHSQKWFYARSENSQLSIKVRVYFYVESGMGLRENLNQIESFNFGRDE